MMESKLSVMERVKRDEGAGGGGGEIGHLSDCGFMIQYLFQSNAISDNHLSLEILTQVIKYPGGRGGGASRGRVSEFCVRLRGLPWESTKVAHDQIFSGIN